MEGIDYRLGALLSFSIMKTPADVPPIHREILCRECGSTRRVPNGTYLRYLREAFNESLNSFACYMDCSPTYICNLELNRIVVPEEVIQLYQNRASSFHLKERVRVSQPDLAPLKIKRKRQGRPQLRRASGHVA
jgi:hypothetical protein